MYDLDDITLSDLYNVLFLHDTVFILQLHKSMTDYSFLYLYTLHRFSLYDTRKVNHNEFNYLTISS